MKLSRGFLLLLSILICFSSVLPRVSAEDTAYTGGNASIISGCHTIDSRNPLLGKEKLLQTAEAVLVYERNSDTLVYAYNPDERVQPASLAKIMTALIALEKGNLEDIVTVTSNAIAPIPEYAATLSLKPGEQFTLDDLMYCLLVGSANDAANVIAEHVSGSVRAFVAEMNIKAKELGCTDTNFINAHGLHQENQYSTARDLAKILRAALEYEQFMVYFSALSYWVPATNQNPSRYLATTNYMMTPGISQIYYDARVTGGRTGVTNDRERSLITTAEYGGLSYISVVLNCTPSFAEDDFTVMRFGSYEETRVLLNNVFNNLRVTQILSEDQVLTQFRVQNGQNAVAVRPSISMYTVLPKDIKLKDLSYQYIDTSTLTAPVENDKYIGTVQIWYNNVCVAQSPVMTCNDVSMVAITSNVSEETRTGDAIATGLTIVAVIILIMVGGFCALFFIRSYQLSRKRANRRRKRADRRRSR